MTVDIIWRPPSMSELTPILFNNHLIHLDSEASILCFDFLILFIFVKYFWCILSSDICWIFLLTLKRRAKFLYHWINIKAAPTYSDIVVFKSKLIWMHELVIKFIPYKTLLKFINIFAINSTKYIRCAV